MQRVVKGIVMDLNKNFAIVMTSGGEFVKVKKPSVDLLLGEEITSKTIESRQWFKYGCLAAAIILAVMPFIYFKAAYATVAYVDIDINPSLELAVNKYNKVNSVIPLNNDASLLIKKTPLKNMDIEEALSTIIDEAKGMGYIKDNSDNNIKISLVNLNENQAKMTSESLFDSAKKHIKN